jgi:prevent-host-death family protein
MKTVEMKEATASLAHYARAAKRGTVVVTAKGKPVAALVSVDAGDMESLSLGTNKKFLSIIERSRARHETEGGVSTEEMRNRLGLKPVPTRKLVVPKKRSGSGIMGTARR